MASETETECPTCEGHGMLCAKCNETPDWFECEAGMEPCARCQGAGVLSSLDEGRGASDEH